MTLRIQTVCGAIAPEKLGLTYMHEHVLTTPPESVDDIDFLMDDRDVAATELGHFRAAGGRTLVEMTTRDYGRDPRGLQQLSEQTGIQIVAVTGWQKERFSARWLAERTVEDLAEQMIREITVGIDDTGIRAGVIKASSSLKTITPAEEKAFRAAAIAQRATGALVSTHTEAGTMAQEQVDVLTGAGVPSDKILIGHLDRKMDLDEHMALVARGVTIGYDQIGKEKYYPDALRIDYVLRLVEAGYADRIVLSGDMARRSSWPSYGNWGGPGLAHILWRFGPWLSERGLSAELLNQILVHTPARLLAIETP